jgi:small-conductance mechanosensitive channel/CRP-like cAMP-binding protein
MLSVIQSQLALIVGALGIVVLFAVRALTKDSHLRRDLGGALLFFVVFVLLRLNGLWIDNVLPHSWLPYVRVTWMLAFAWGMVRIAVASLLWLRGRVTNRPPVKLLRDVMMALLLAFTTIPILQSQLQLNVSTVVGTSAVLSLVLGFALQDTLSNLFSGISLQMEGPFKEGDYIRVQTHEGRVVQISWRSCSIMTNRSEIVTLPNALIAKEAVKNFTRFNEPMGAEIIIGATYNVAPNHFKSEVLAGLLAIDMVAKDPAPIVRVQEFGDSSMKYLIRFYLSDYAQVTLVQDEVLTHLWYRFGRAGIEIPYPQRVVTTKTADSTPHRLANEAVASLELFSAFEQDERQDLLASARERRFGRGEAVVQEGDLGETFYAVVTGTLAVLAGQPAKEVAQISKGQGFGEMSLLTGEPRAATVRAIEDCLLLEFDRAAFRRFFAAHPERIASLATLLAERKARLDEMSTKSALSPKRETNRIMETLRQILKLGGD